MGVMNELGRRKTPPARPAADGTTKSSSRYESFLSVSTGQPKAWPPPLRKGVKPSGEPAVSLVLYIMGLKWADFMKRSALA